MSTSTSAASAIVAIAAPKSRVKTISIDIGANAPPSSLREERRSPSPTWDVRSCTEFGTEQVARGIYEVDASRGLDTAGEPRYINTGGFGVAVDVVDVSDPLRSRHVLRISSDEEMFDKLRDISTSINDLLAKGNSPFFLETRTTFSCDEFPALEGEDWHQVALAVAQKFMPSEFVANDFDVNNAVPVRLFYMVIERAELFDVRTGLLENWARVESLDDRDAHGLNEFKRALAFQLTQGMAALHEIAISHRDVTSGNVVFSARPGATDDVFVLADDRNADKLTYEVPRQTSIPGVLDDDSKTVVTPHYIDYDLAIRVISNESERNGRGVVRRADIVNEDAQVRVLHATRTIRGSPETIAPELLYLSFVGFNSDPELLFKPDTYSLGVLIGEIIVGFDTYDLLIRAGFDKDKFTRQNSAIIQAALSGFPSLADLVEYRNSFESRVAELRQDGTVRNSDEDQIAAFDELLRNLEQWREALEDTLEGRRSDDPLLSEWGISAKRFKQGVLFGFLERQRKKALVERSVVSFLRRALNWDYRSRPRVSELLTHPLFDSFLQEQLKSWQLPVSRLRSRAKSIVAGVEPGSPRLPPPAGSTPSLRRRRATVAVLGSSLHGDDDDDDDDDSSLNARQRRAKQLLDELRRLKSAAALCTAPECVKLGVLEFVEQQEQGEMFCSEACARIYWTMARQRSSTLKKKKQRSPLRHDITVAPPSSENDRKRE